MVIHFFYCSLHILSILSNVKNSSDALTKKVIADQLNHERKMVANIKSTSKIKTNYKLEIYILEI